MSELHRIRLAATQPSPQVLHRRAMWAQALRSNNYLRGLRKLRSPLNEFCPLGVAGDVFARELHREGLWTKDTTGEWRFQKSRFFISDEVANWYGINRFGAFFVPNDDNVHTIPEMNDERGWTFEDTAALVEDPRIVWAPGPLVDATLVPLAVG